MLFESESANSSSSSSASSLSVPPPLSCSKTSGENVDVNSDSECVPSLGEAASAAASGDPIDPAVQTGDKE